MIHDIEPNPSPVPTLQTQIDWLAERVKELDRVVQTIVQTSHDPAVFMAMAENHAPAPPAPAPDFTSVPEIDESLVDLVVTVAPDMAPSKGAARRLIAQGGVKLEGDTLRVGKHTYQIPPPTTARAVTDEELARVFATALENEHDKGAAVTSEQLANQVLAGIRAVRERLAEAVPELTDAMVDAGARAYQEHVDRMSFAPNARIVRDILAAALAEAGT